MNFVAHLVVATSATGVAPGSDLAVGAMLPDLASMAGTRVDRGRLPDSVVQGVMVHHQTDTAFHDHRLFVEVLRNDVPALEAAGLPRGAARASAHVGAELLLDGVLLDDDRVASALAVAVDALDIGQLGRLDESEELRWSTLFDRMHTGMNRDAYASAELVAERLRHMLARRPRLALPAACEAALVEHLRWRRDWVVAVAPTLVAEVTDAVRAGGATGT